MASLPIWGTKLAEAVHELRNDEFAELYADEIKGEGQISGEEFVDECQIESDLELLLPATYVTGSSERMLLYRELDGLTLDKDVDAFRFRLERRNCFASFPSVAWRRDWEWRRSS